MYGNGLAFLVVMRYFNTLASHFALTFRCRVYLLERPPRESYSSLLHLSMLSAAFLSPAPACLAVEACAVCKTELLQSVDVTLHAQSIVPSLSQSLLLILVKPHASFTFLYYQNCVSIPKCQATLLHSSTLYFKACLYKH